MDSSATYGGWWYLDFDAPIDETLTAGTTYANAIRYPFSGVPDSSYLDRFAATFEQHCVGAEPACGGEVRIVNSAAPQPLGLGIDVAADGPSAG